ncbi:MAG: MinD/ParA family protein [Promicromonosporaceae bacterium]|nr:MinD/ParA family protein [Promicromonosporaceae bacterium]
MSIGVEEHRWARPAGTALLGQVAGSGLTSPAYLVRRPDGQVVQVSALVNTVLSRLDPQRTPAQVADAVSQSFGRTLTVEGLDLLVSSKLGPVGLAEDASAQAPDVEVAPPKSAPLLSLSLRGTLMPARAVRGVSRVLRPTFHPVVVVVVLAAWLAVDFAVVANAHVVNAIAFVFATPTTLVGIFLLMTVSALIHEMGHATACAYGGAEPGRIGVGVYLIAPAFFTNVTDSYRLNRAGRLRTDLGGLYFTVWCLLGVGVAYLVTGSPVLVVVLVLMHVEALEQLLPTVRLDGYFVLADLAGVPDLFARIGPVLRSQLPGRTMDPRVADMRPGARRAVTAWVLAVVPLLLGGLVWLALNLPKLVSTAVLAVEHQWSLLLAALSAHDVADVLLGIVSIALLAVPLVGLAVLAARTVLSVGALARRRLARPHRSRRQIMDTLTTPEALAGPAAVPSAPGEAPPASAPADAPPTTAPTGLVGPKRRSGPTAADLTDEAVLGSPRRLAASGWRRAVRAGTHGAVALGPGKAELRRDSLHDRVRAPIDGTRRVVVMSRKGGVGKTSVTVGLGATFATLRGDRVVAVDANPDAGNLSGRIAGDCDRTITDLLAAADRIDSFSTMRRYTSQCPESRLEVLASNDDARITQALDRAAYRRVVGVLDHFYNLVLLDTGTGILDSANQGLLAEADELVLVLRPALDGARAGAQTLDWLDEHGYPDLVRTAVVVLNAVADPEDPAVHVISEHFAQRCAHVTLIPWDKTLQAGGHTTLGALEPATREAFTEVAAALADSFHTNWRAER